MCIIGYHLRKYVSHTTMYYQAGEHIRLAGPLAGLLHATYSLLHSTKSVTGTCQGHCKLMMNDAICVIVRLPVLVTL